MKFVKRLALVPALVPMITLLAAGFFTAQRDFIFAAQSDSPKQASKTSVKSTASAPAKTPPKAAAKAPAKAPAKSVARTAPLKPGSAKSTAGRASAAGKATTAGKGKASKAPPRSYAQLQPAPERYKEIQQALADKGYFRGPVDGTWGADSSDAMKRFQTEQNLDADGKISALSLVALGLGPRRASGTAPVQPTTSVPLDGATQHQ